MPTLRSAIWSLTNIGSCRRPKRVVSKPFPMGTTASAINAVMRAKAGAMIKNGLFAWLGIMSSLKMNFTPSASGWRNPNGPTRLGPSLSCMNALTLRSASVR
jgi:hypothetical protein